MNPAIEHHAPADHAEFNLERFMAALAAVESGSTPNDMKWNAAGKHAELGPWQITRAAWKETCDLFAFCYASDPDVGTGVVATRIYALAEECGTTNGKYCAAYIAHKWNPRAGSEYVKRVLAVYESL